MKVLKIEYIETVTETLIKCCDAYGNAREDGGLSSIIWGL